MQLTSKWNDYVESLRTIERSCVRIDRVFDEICAILDRDEVTLRDFKFIVGSIERMFEWDIPFKSKERMPFRAKTREK